MNDPGLNNLLKWGIENSASSRNDPTAPPPTTQFDIQAMQDFLNNGPKLMSDATLMRISMATIQGPTEKEIQEGATANASLEQKVEAFETLETLVQGIDNANNLESLGLWSKLVEELENTEPELRKGAAWCAGTAVQNNPQAQQRLLILGAIPTLVKMSTEDEDNEVRIKAIRALSSVSRNFQPGLDAVVEHLPARFKPKEKLDSADMASVDTLRDALRAEAGK